MATEPHGPHSRSGIEDSITFASIPMGGLFQGVVMQGDDMLYRSLTRHAIRAEAVASVKRAWLHVDQQLRNQSVTTARRTA